MKPRETGGNVPKAKTKKVRQPIATRRTYVAPPKPRVVKVAPEATRPVTPKQRQQINRNAEAQQRRFVVKRGSQKAEHAEPLHISNPRAFEKANQHSKLAGAMDASVGGASKEISRKLISPGLKVLQATTIPLHAVAGAAEQATGRGVKGLTPRQLVKGAEKGIKKKTTYSDVLKTAGVGNKTVRAVAGFAGDVALDPLTYATFGTATVARKAAQKAGEKAYAEAAAKGLSHVKATKVAEDAAEKAHAKAPQNKGITLTVAGRSTSGRTTAAVSRKLGLSKAATKVRETKAVQGIASDLRPDFRPKGVSEEQHTTIRAASREARAQTTRGRVGAVSKAQALRKALPKDDYAQVVNAIERGTVYDLPEHLRSAGRDVELTFRRARKAEVKAGIQTPNRRQYFAHAIEDLEGGKKAGKGGGKRVIKPTYAKGRQYQGTIAQIASSGGPQFSTNIPAVTADRLARSAKDVAQAKFNRSLLEAGRKVKPDEELALESGEALYRIKGPDVEKVARKDERRVLAGETTNLRVLNERSVDQAYQSIAPGSSRSTVGKGYDKLQGGFKFIATAPNPGFHMRNLYGDTQNAYLAQPAHKLVVNMGRSAKTLHALGKEETAARTVGGKLDPTKAGIRVKGKYGGQEFITYDKLAEEAVSHGAIRSGFLSKEIPELVRDTAKKVKGKERLVRTKRLVQNREDLPRLATYIGARKRGLTPREASDWASKHHFDYADLTGFERTVMRRLLPFYCVPADHEILTRRGFKTYDQIEIGEDVLSLDHETGALEWTPLLDVATFDYDGPLKTIKRRGADFAFTEDHRWPVVTSKTFTKGKWYGGKRLIKRAYELGRSDSIPLTGEYAEIASVLTPRQAAILGWLVGDGYFRWRGNYCEMLVYQSPQKHLAEVVSLLGTTPRKPHPDTGVIPVGVALADAQSLAAAGFRSKDDLLKLVSRLSREAAEAMWDAMMKAEGWTSVTGQQGFTQVAGPVLEAFQMLCLLTGRTCNIGPARAGTAWTRQPSHVAYVRKSKTTQIKSLGETHYTGTIWCPQTKHGTWVMRHNGTVIMTGNTFSARNIPLQAKKLVTNPGKYANVEKLREELAKSAGLPEDWQSRIPEYQQRGTPFPITIGGKVILASPALPLNDLNQLSVPGVTSADFGASLTEQGKKFLSMLNPVVKSPVELYANYNFFFRGPIQRETGPLVAAPAYVSAMPKSWRKKLGIVSDFQDPKSGKKGWGWPAKVDYVAKVLPGPTNVGQQLITPLANRRGQGSLGKVISYVGGIKPDPYQPADAALTSAYDELSKLEIKRAALRQRGQGSAQGGRKETAAYIKVRDRIKELNTTIDALKAKRGDAPKAKRVRRGGSLISQSSGPSIESILGHDAPSVNDILAP